MIYRRWMSYVRDDVKITNLVIPSAHNAGSYGMKPVACCQDGNFYEQFLYGIRHFCVRLDTDKKGNILLCHGIKKGDAFENALKDWQRMLEENDSEFFIFDVREYYTQHLIGNINLKFSADPKKVDELLAKYIQPEKYAFTDFTDISNVTMGDLRASGKRYILLNYKKEYAYSVNCPHIIPWDKIIHGLPAQHFVKKAVGFFDSFEIDGLFWFQTQQTPNLGTQIGFRTPRKLDQTLRPLYYKLIESIANNPKYLAKANIISGDFMTEDYMKVRSILMLNILKNNLYEDKNVEFLKGLWKSEL
ncbi:MAG: hypothetical protein ACI4M8_02070 [Christensenellales bacterium]